MPLYPLQSLEDCASYAKSVEPYIGELWELPPAIVSRIGALIRGEDGPTLVESYVNTNPLVSGFTLSLALGWIFLVVAELNRNYSQVDRCWSILPTLYLFHFDLWAHLAGRPSQRLDAVLLFGVIWSARLTFNYARKGGYARGSEDYRWEIIKAALPPFLFHLLNFTFISFIQSVLLFLLAAPAYAILLASDIEQNLTAADWAFTCVELSLVLVELVSDEQQWRYQSAKRQYLALAKVPAGYTQTALDRGFITDGLFQYSRHPNFAAEQTIWLVLYQWSCFATNSLYSWTGTGAAFLVLLFQASTYLTESITSAKYPEYKEYQKQVSTFIPTAWGGYQTPVVQPKIIRTSDLARMAQEKVAKASGAQPGGRAARR